MSWRFIDDHFTAGGLPINESFFGILTDVKLLELSNADVPVLVNGLACAGDEPAFARRRQLLKMHVARWS